MRLGANAIDLAFVIKLETLREVLQGLSIAGRRWWIASDPADAVESRTVTIGHGDINCRDRLNTLYYAFPVINDAEVIGECGGLILLIDCSVVSAEQPGLYFENGRVCQDSLADLEAFFDPIQRALVERLQTSQGNA